MNEYLLEVYINDHKTYQMINCFRDQDKKIWVAAADLLRWHLTLPKDPPWQNNNIDYYQLNWIKDVSYQVNEQSLSIFISIPVKYLPPTVIGFSQELIPKIRPSQPGSFLNYDVSLQRNNIISQTTIGALTEIVHFNRWGVGSADFVVNNVGLDGDFARLETTWTIDQPENLTSIRFGDAISRTLAWGGSVHFGGFQWGTNFGTQPYLITFPLPAYKGEAIVPTSMSVLVNDSLRLRENIQTGPFTIQNLPVVTGEGDVKIVTQDILGRLQEFVIPYYASEQLLKPGLKDYSYEIGFIRNNLGISSFDYGRLLGTGTYREGLNDRWTAGWHGELLSSQQTFGLSSDFLWRHYLIGTVAAAASHSGLGNGALMMLGIQRKTQTLSYGTQGIYSSPNFTQLGMIPNQPAPSLRMQIYGTYATNSYGTLSVSYTRIHDRQQTIFDENGSLSLLPNTQLLTVNYSRNVFGGLYFIFNGIFNFNQSHNNLISLSLVKGFSGQRSLTASAAYQPDDNQQTLFFNKNLPFGDGYGYHVLATHGTPNQGEGYFAYQNDNGTYTGKISQFDDYTNYLAEISGSFIYFGGHALFSRLTYDSFALVEVPGFEDVCIYSRNVCVGKTNKKGILLLPNQLAYQYNKISIEPKDLPLNAEIDATQFNVVPYYRSGILTKFPVKKVRNLTFRLTRYDHQFVPAGAQIKVKGQQQSYFVGENGYSYIGTQSNGIITGNVEWDDKQCGFQFRVPQADEPLTDIGAINCYDYQ